MSVRKKKKKNVTQTQTEPPPAGGQNDVCDTIEILPQTPHQRQGYKPVQAYPAAFRRQVVEALLSETDASVGEICNRFNISEAALYDWKEEMKEYVLAIKEINDMRLARRIEALVKEFLCAATKDKLEKASLRDLAIAIGILVDKRSELWGKRGDKRGVALRVAWKSAEGQEFSMEAVSAQ